MTLTARDLSHIVNRLLTEGVPPSVVSRVFDLEPDLVRAAQKRIRVRRYGTDDLAEYMEQLNWEAVDNARQMLAHGTSAESIRVLSHLLGKQMAINGRRTPEAIRQGRDQLFDLMESMKKGTAEVDAEARRSRFIAVEGGGED